LQIAGATTASYCESQDKKVSRARLKAETDVTLKSSVIDFGREYQTAGTLYNTASMAEGTTSENRAAVAKLKMSTGPQLCLATWPVYMRAGSGHAGDAGIPGDL
jgi:hypothetical protein